MHVYAKLFSSPPKQRFPTMHSITKAGYPSPSSYCCDSLRTRILESNTWPALGAYKTNKLHDPCRSHLYSYLDVFNKPFSTPPKPYLRKRNPYTRQHDIDPIEDSEFGRQHPAPSSRRATRGEKRTLHVRRENCTILAVVI